VILTAIICYATHAPLDALTSYGTQLFWPFSNTRAALDWIGIVDPVYSLPLLAGVIWTARTGRARAARMALLLTSLYLCFGGWQHHRAVQTQRQLAAMRGQPMLHARAMPAPGWLVMWRSVYVTQGETGKGLVVDGMRIPWFGAPRVLEGGSVLSARFEELPASAQANAQTRRRFDIFNWFADGLIAKISGEENAYGDERFTIDVESLVPLWGLKIDPATGAARRWSPPPSQGRNFSRALRTLVFGDARYRTLEELKR
jgi:inner membrane protein